MLEIKDIHKKYALIKTENTEVIKGVSYSFPEKGIVVLYGSSGCGKTTLLNIIGGLLDSDKGRVTFNGKHINVGSDYMRNRHIGFKIV